MTSGYALADPYTLNNAQLTDVFSSCNGCSGITSVMAIEGVNGDPKSLCSMLWVIPFFTASMALARDSLDHAPWLVFLTYVLGIVLVHA